MRHPLKNSVTTTADHAKAAVYSARKKVANFIPVYSVWYPAIISDSASTISKGDRFNDVELKTHEKIFCSAMTDDEIELTEFIKKIFDQYNYDDYYELMMKMQSQSGLLNIIEDRVFFNIFSKKRKELTETGVDVNSKIKDILSTGKKNLYDWVLNDPPRAKAFMAACGVNLILLEGHDMGMLQSYESKLKDIEKQKHDDSGFIFWGEDHYGGNSIFRYVLMYVLRQSIEAVDLSGSESAG